MNMDIFFLVEVPLGAERRERGQGWGMTGWGGWKGDESSAKSACQILFPLAAASLLPFSPRTCTSEIAGQIQGDSLWVERLMLG